VVYLIVYLIYLVLSYSYLKSVRTQIVHHKDFYLNEEEYKDSVSKLQRNIQLQEERDEEDGIKP
jgi:hypothetical protein